MPGVYSTAVGYAGGHTPNPDYRCASYAALPVCRLISRWRLPTMRCGREVCSGLTGHNEVVQVVWDPSKVQQEAVDL